VVSEDPRESAAAPRALDAVIQRGCVDMARRVATPVSLIERLGLVPLPDEGGHYRETWRAGESAPADALPARCRGGRAFGTAILYLLCSCCIRTAAARP
jgi:Cupin superfamily (DUF985)